MGTRQYQAEISSTTVIEEMGILFNKDSGIFCREKGGGEGG